jgi:diadenylate cyclase
MAEFWEGLAGAWRKVTWITVLDVGIVAFLIYQFVINVRGRRAGQVMIGLLALLGIYLAAARLGLELVRSLLAQLAPFAGIVVVILFQAEIRRMLARISWRRLPGFGERLERREAAAEIVLALEYLSANRTGALIVVERDIGLKTFIETGIPLDATLSRDLLVSIFFPKSPMHDGAAIVQGDRVAAASCFLPLAINPALMTTLGSRHRAAIGVTEDTDAIAIVASEETGNLAYAYHGELHRQVTLAEIENILTVDLPERPEKTPAAQPDPAGERMESPR